MLPYHVQPDTSACEVCEYSVREQIDVAYEHALIRARHGTLATRSR
jgi:hypothetical protein